MEAIDEAGRKARRQERAIKTESRKHICLHFQAGGQAGEGRVLGTPGTEHYFGWRSEIKKK